MKQRDWWDIAAFCSLLSIAFWLTTGMGWWTSIDPARGISVFRGVMLGIGHAIPLAVYVFRRI